jgi:hypothetical protein
MDKQLELLGACGLFCGACNHYRASLPGGEHLLEKAVQHGWKREGYICKGCRSSILYIQSGCSQCEIRKCADMKGILHCGSCSDFPCDRIKKFQCDGHAHHLDIFSHLKDLERKGPEVWLTEQEDRWKCVCGTRFSWYEEECRVCGALLNSYGPLPRKNS